MKNLTKQQKIMLIRIISAVALLIAFVGVLSKFTLFSSVSFAIYVAIYLLIGYDVIYSAIRGIFRGRLLDEKFLMLIATLGAFLLGEFVEAVAVMLFYQVGEFFQGYAVGKSRRSISELMDICPEYANIEDAGTIKRVLPDLVSVGDIIIVKPGEKIPMDGVVTEGTSFLDTSSITGESVHREVTPGTNVISGCINAGSLLKIRVSKSFEDSTVSKILELIEESSFNKSKSENFISRFARVYTPAVVACAAIVFALGSLITSEITLWLQRALIFLVVSCPCALVVSVPLSFFAAIGCGSKNGILIKGSNWIEALSKAETVVFDKTGTLTKGNFVITEVFPKGECTTEELIKKAYACEYYSIHPIAEAIKLSAGEICTEEIFEFENLPGLGVKAKYDGKTLRCGNEKYIRQYVSDMPDTQKTAYTAVHICEDNEYLGHIIISDEIKPNAKESISRLKKMGIKSAIFTGDNSSVALYTGKLLGCDTVESELLPQEKTERFSRLIEKKGKNRTVAFAGDGINDAPVLSMADVGIAMGSLGSDAAIEAADIVIMNDDISKITFAIRLCKKTMSIVWQNVVFSIGIKILVMLLAGLGMANMWLAVFADVGVAFLAILNAFRAFNIKM